MSPEIHIFSDRVPSSALPKKLAENLDSLGLIEKSGLGESVSFCGMLMRENQISIFLPRSSEHSTMDEAAKIKIASVTLKAVEKYGRDKKTRIKLQDEDDGAIGLSQLSLIRGILEDFINYKIYTRRKNVYTSNNAKPDWSRTISRSIAAIGKDGVPVYLDIHCLQKKNFNSEVSIIHANIVRQLDESFSWILTGRKGLLAPELKDYPEPFSSVDYQIYLLQRELHLTYAERDIRLLKLLIRFLKNQHGTRESIFISGLRSFHYAWEHMLKNVLTDVIEVNKLLPAPCYINPIGKVMHANEKSMRTDIVVSVQGTNLFSVIDAKYYAATGTDNAPGWSDLVKQFFYAKALKSIYPTATIRNIFVFPGTTQHLIQARVRDRKILPDHFYDTEFPPVECFYVCPLTVITNYASGKHDRLLSQHFLKHPES